MRQPHVLILCTGNSCRSHLAEGLLRREAGDLFTVSSAGSNPSGYVHPMAVAALAEVGVDISQHISKHVDQFMTEEIDVVITVCDSANEVCPVFPRPVRRHHWGFADPPKDIRPGETAMDAFRRIRDEIARAVVAYAAGYRDALAVARSAQN